MTTNFYKLDLSETMKTALKNVNSITGSSMEKIGYVTEKLYMLLQLYIQNKGWNQNVDLMQSFSEIKDQIPNSAYLQVLSNRFNLDSQGRFVLRDNGKIVLPFEHFANAVMLKHMSGPHGLHLSLEATIRAVVDSYTIGRENFGMEKEFIVEVVQSCPSVGCRYYKNHSQLGISNFIENSSYSNQSSEFGNQNLYQSTHHILSQTPTAEIDLTKSSAASNQKNVPNKQQMTVAIIQQQNRAMTVQQNIEKFSNLTGLEKQRFLQQLDKKHLENVSSASQQSPVLTQSNIQQSGYIQTNSSIANVISNAASQLQQSDHLKNDILKDSLECIESNKDLLALHNGAWTTMDNAVVGLAVGQDKIIRAFSELMRNIGRMKTYIRPSMCKPYGKQSESLQKTLIDTAQLVQSLRNCLPAPHIQVNSWKSEDQRPRIEGEIVIRTSQG